MLPLPRALFRALQDTPTDRVARLPLADMLADPAESWTLVPSLAKPTKLQARAPLVPCTVAITNRLAVSPVPGVIGPPSRKPVTSGQVLLGIRSEAWAAAGQLFTPWTTFRTRAAGLLVVTAQDRTLEAVPEIELPPPTVTGRCMREGSAEVTSVQVNGFFWSRAGLALVREVKSTTAVKLKVRAAGSVRPSTIDRTD